MGLVMIDVTALSYVLVSNRETRDSSVGLGEMRLANGLISL